MGSAGARPFALFVLVNKAYFILSTKDNHNLKLTDGFLLESGETYDIELQVDKLFNYV